MKMRVHWNPVAFIPIYDSEKSKRPSQGYECDSARAMRLYHDGRCPCGMGITAWSPLAGRLGEEKSLCWRHVLGQ